MKKQLNNLSKGKVIKVIKVGENNIVYNIYENTQCLEKNLYPETKVLEAIDTSYVPTELMSIADAKIEAAIYKIAEKETNFVLSEDLQNWNILKSSTQLDTTVRVFIPNIAYDIALENKDKEESDFYNLYQVIIGVQLGLASDTSNITPHFMCQYLEEIYPQSKDALQYYIDKYPELGIVIENKNVA